MSKSILLLFLWIIFTDQISAECMHSGDLYLNGSTWNPDTCSSCTCQDPIAVCNRKRCSLSACDPRHGKRLIISTGTCCPVCKDMRNSCHKDGKVYENDAVWDISSCMTCHCKWGRVDCSSRKCPTVHCLPEETLEQLPGQCCPKCVQTRNSCLHNDSYHPDGSSWNPIPCTKCFCQNGRVKCFPVQCPSLACPTGHTMLSKGECCPQCTAFTCKHEGHAFQEGDSWQKTPCEVCSCIAGEVFCIQNQCDNNLSCPRGQIPWTFPGECCPECVNPSGQCDQIIPARVNKEIWQGKTCEFCHCNRGNVHCQKALCPRISCQKPFVKVHKEDMCCAECILPQDCEFNDRKYKSGKIWHPDSCSVCSCNNGDVSCYQQTCIVCPPNTYHIPTESSCCGYCQPYECTLECAECIPDQPSVCTKCANPEQFVHNGKCKDECPGGYYGSSENLCKKCHESCLSCSKGGPYYCSICKSGLLYLEGQCVSQCPEGYHLQNWRCQACHRSCRTCIGPEMRQCLSCTLPGQLLFNGRCVDRCPPAMYVENKHCIACTQGCLKCSASSKKCLICADDAILHNGYCSLSCPDGFYAAPDGIHCIACHPACLKCDGGREDNCLSCHGGAQLREGKCHLPCSPGYYRTYEGLCKSCHDGCELCHLDPTSKKSNCISCTNGRERPSGSKCVSSCGESQYLQNGFCRDCASDCLRCTNEWTCQECQLPLVLSEGKCVTHCATTEYVHASKGRICNGCSPGCAKCNDTFNCFACFDGMFLKNNAECVEDCGPDYYSNSEKRQCEENSFAPEIRVVDQLLINGTEEIGSMLDIVEVLDADTSEEDLIIYLVKPPENGNIVRIDHGKDVTLAAKDTFSLKEMKNNRVIYVPGEERMTKDVFLLKASDRQLFSEEAVVHAVALPDGEIELVRSKSLTAIAGDVTLFSSKNVDFISEVSPEDVTLTILAGPFHGNFATSQEEMKVFTLEQLQQGGISYHHDGNNAIEDSFVLQAYDGYNVLNTIVDIHIRSKDSKKPILMNNKIGYVKKGKMMQISSELLKTVSADQKGTKNGDIVYTLVPSHNNPQNGDLIMVVPALHDKHEEDEGWQMMNKNQMSQPLVRFLQRDIDEGRIWYKHKGGEETLDKFHFEVADTSVPPHVLSHQEFQISVSGSTALVSKSEDGSNKISVSPKESPVLVTEQIFVKEDHSVILTNSSLSIIGLGHKPLEVIFKVDQPPLHGVLKKKRVYMDLPFEAEYLKKNDSFTYKDILEGLILYKHEGNEETTDSFTLNITNGAFFDRVVISVVIGLIHDETPRVDINDVLRIQKGSTETITSSLLKSTDVDTDDSKLIYRFVQAPDSGSVRLNKNGVIQELTTQKPHNTFTQTDINKGRLEYSDDGSGNPGIVKFKFTVADPQGNELLNQYFYINILEDRFPPKVDRNQRLILHEGGSALLTKTLLSASDDNVNKALLIYTVDRQPRFGRLESNFAPGVRISVFKQSDLFANKVKYVHTRPNEVHSDSFLFSVSDGQNKVDEEFIISIIPVDNSIPVVINKGLRAQEGTRHMITEFDLKAIDNDTKVDQIVFNVVDPTWHGVLQLKQQGTHNYGSAVSSFTMEDIYKNRLSYLHGGSESQMDFFKFTVTDGTHILFSTQDETGEILPPSVKPSKFEIRILPLSDGSPILERNLGLQFFENDDYGAFNVISEKELKSTSLNTEDKDLIYVITSAPKFGQLQNNNNSESSVVSFTQEDINQGKIIYILTGNSSVGEDHFVFDLRNTGTHIVPHNTFHISWSIVSFEEPVFNISETDRVLRIPLVRTGNLKQYSVVTCVTSPGSATSMKSESVQGTYDFVQHSGQIQFDEWQTRKECVITINDDIIFEGEETFYVELRASDHAVIGQHSEVAVSIYDPEDEPAIEFTQETFHVNETDGYLIAGLKRTGDTSQAVSVICSTASMTATGSTGVQSQSGADFIGREETNSYRVVIPQDLKQATCAVKIIDDNIDEAAEHFELILSTPSSGARLGSVSKAIATIDGPNDESLLFFSQWLYVFNESAGIAEIDVLRSSSDQTHTSIVWCATRLSSPLSALPRKDYVPVANRITFRPGQTIGKCQLTIIDDDINPKLEGNETFEVFLSSPVGSNLHQPFSAVILITDFAEDVAILQFENSQYEVDEKNSSINVPIERSGDIGYESTIICYTRQGTAETGIDFKERRYHQSSAITFKPGEMTKNCTVSIKDDTNFENNESFSLFLSSAFGDKTFPVVRIGEKNNATIVITNSDDVPRLQFKEAAYSIAEPKAVNQINTVIVQVVRTGDINQKSSVRCSTCDFSAVSGLDYNAKSVILHFKPGIKGLDFAVDVLYNSEMEWHESFTILLEPEEVVGAELGEIHSTTVTILDNKVSGSIVFPAVPMVVSLPYYDDVEKGLDINPSPGYPLVCVTPCDPHYPGYQSTRNLCEKEGINSTQVSFKWEAAYPNQIGGNTYQPFVELTDNTLFTSVTGLVLDSVYFRPRFRLRCSATPLDQNGKAGIRLKSNIVEISPHDSICHSPIYPGDPFSYQAQSFIASLMYTPISDSKHPNTIQISVTIPHQDGMLPLVSTMPLNNIKFLLSDPMYRQQHVCSNLMSPSFDNSKNDTGFFAFNPKRVHFNSGSAFAYQFDEGLRTQQTLQLYRHLNLERCTWTFRAWYHMTDLVDLCGGKILTNFEVTDTGQSFLTVRVPLYVSYLYASAAVSWSSLEHHTEMQFSFYYQTVLWKTGLEEDGQFGGQLQVLRIAIGEDGHLVIDFRTQTNFRGLYVLEHPTQPSMKSRLLPPDEMPISFDLVLLWSEKTYDSPKQLWRATSHYNREDYTGQYIVELLPCTVEPTQKYVAAQKPIKCSAYKPQRFQLPISFKQTNRPVPAKYSLNTRFQLTNNEKLFSSDPGSMDNSGSSIEELNYNGAFSEGQKIYGRVLWNPDQDLSTAYELSIKKVYICTGKDGYIPTYDPTGEIYEEGSQFGCVRPNSNLKHRYLVLDRDHEEKFKIDAPNFEFGAKFVQENSQYSHLKQLPGVDGFEMPVDPLYKINSGHQWYLQVLYVIGPTNSPSRVQRSVILTYGKSLLKDDENKNGTNMRMFLLDKEVLASRAGDIISTIVPGVALFILLLAIISFIFIRRHLKRKQIPLESSMVSSSVGLTRVSRKGSVNRGTQV